ncbi:MAG: PadR family transcriptional regulator [Anaerolineae bacterium]|nr:PadR family transcriptional regulator [Anaerolineae bacterium]
MGKNKYSDELEVALLGFLYYQPKHGYDLYKEITSLSGIGLVWHVKMGHLYAMLHRLEENKWVDCTITQQGNRPQRNQYSITESGKKKFDDWQVQPVQKGREFRIVFLLKMYFALRSGKQDIGLLIANQKKTCETWLADLEISPRENPQPDFTRIVHNFRQTQIRGYIHWLEWCNKNFS